MRTATFGLGLALAALASLSGCAGGASFVKSDATLGRVVVYRNGIAYYERFATVTGDDLKLTVPPDKVDDFLKSLVVVDAKSGKPVGVSYPTSGGESDAGVVHMKVQIPQGGSRELKIAYVTEAPAWKPSYRVSLGKDGKVLLQGWAIVDNVSGEDWENVKLGVGSGSALSFRFDLRSVRLVSRETLRSDDLFAMAPPVGTPIFPGAQPDQQQKVLSELSDTAIAAVKPSYHFEDDKLAAGSRVPAEKPKDATKAVKAPPRIAPAPQAAPGGRAARAIDVAEVRGGDAMRGPAAPLPPPPPDPISQLANQLKNNKQTITIEGYAAKEDQDKNLASLDRANKVREQLLRNGVPPDQVVAVGAGEVAGRQAGVRVIEAAPKPRTDEEKKALASADLAPIDTSLFQSDVPMTVGRGKSAMVSIVNQDTDGDVVYLFDAESPRGNATFAFKSIRVKNPTDSALETGPVTVFGTSGGFVGEGLTDAIPPKSVAFIPFALDRQIAVETKGAERDEISKILTVQRGVFSTEVQHVRRTTFVVQNRLGERAVLYVRHTVPKGYDLVKSPDKIERVGQAHLFRVELGAGEKREIVVEEQTPVLKTTDIRSNVGMDMVKAYLSSAAVQGPLKEKVAEIVKHQQDIGNLEQKISTARDQMAEYRSRMDELTAQIFSLKAVKTAGPLMKSLEQKLQETSDRVSKQTLDIVTLQEQLMVAKIKMQDRISELSLGGDKPKEEPKPAPKPDAAPKGPRAAR